MNILAIETATEACSAALLTSSGEFSEFQVAPQKHSQLILPMVDNLLVQSTLNKAELDYLVFGRGPGSFTGVRIATGIVQGLAMSLDIPVAAVSTLATMAQEAAEKTQKDRVAVAIDARMGEVYFGLFIKDENGIVQLQGQEQVLPPKQANELLRQAFVIEEVDFAIAGTGWKAYSELVSDELEKLMVHSEVLYPNAKYMLPIAKLMITQNQLLSVEEVQPMYVRDEVTWKKLPGR